MSGLEGKVALVTGSAQGIGEEIAMTLADNGCNICVTDVNLELAQKVAENLRKKGIKSEAYKLDVSNFNEVEQVVKIVLDNFSKIDILVNNAGITRDNLLLRMAENDWDLVLDINLKGAFNCTKAVIKSMVKNRYGRIINMSSIVGVMGNAGQANYSASKGGLIAFTKSCAKELGSRNINVNAIAPGFIKTRMTEFLNDEDRKKMEDMIPLKRMGTPKDVALACLFLASDQADYITGQILQVDGGIVI